MQRIELTIASNYAPNWTVADAFRELFQNALDQEILDPTDKMSWTYENNTVTISNKKAILTTQSLLLGLTTKEDEPDMIGKYGEGYKIAALVLLRHNKQVTIYNYGAREVWRPKFVKSKRFGTNILTFFIDDTYVWETKPQNNLTIEVSDISEKEWIDEIVQTNLHLQTNINIVESTSYGSVLGAAEHSGRIFVNGLYICDHSPFRFGYDIKPEYITLERDRTYAKTYELRWVTAMIWAETKSDKLLGYVAEGLKDVDLILPCINTTEYRNAAYKLFRTTYGPDAVPVYTQKDIDDLPMGYTPIMVPVDYALLIQQSEYYDTPPKRSENITRSLVNWVHKVEDKLDEHEITAFNQLVRVVERGLTNDDC